jgi:hypothetical protein
MTYFEKENMSNPYALATWRAKNKGVSDFSRGSSGSKMRNKMAGEIQGIRNEPGPPEGKQLRMNLSKEVDPKLKAKIEDRIPELNTPTQKKVMSDLELLSQKTLEVIKALNGDVEASGIRRLNAMNTAQENLSNTQISEPDEPAEKEDTNGPTGNPSQTPPNQTPPVQSLMQSIKSLMNFAQKQALLEDTTRLINKAEEKLLINRFVKEFKNKLILKELYDKDAELLSMAEELNIRKGYNLTFIRPERVAKELFTEAQASECTCVKCSGTCMKGLNKQLLPNVRKSLELEKGKEFWKLYDRAIKNGPQKLNDEELVTLREFLYSRI